jgi:hypothetical protein
LQSGGGGEELAFDVETAIRVCRGAGYFTHALQLAERSAKHDLYLKIQIEDHRDYAKALTYIATLDFDEVRGEEGRRGERERVREREGVRERERERVRDREREGEREREREGEREREMSSLSKPNTA